MYELLASVLHDLIDAVALTVEKRQELHSKASAVATATTPASAPVETAAAEPGPPGAEAPGDTASATPENITGSPAVEEGTPATTPEG